MWPWRSIESLAESTSFYLNQSQEDLVVEKGTVPPEKVPLPMDTLLRGKKPMSIFHNIGSLLRPLELVPTSRERVVPPRSDWRLHIKFHIDSSSSASVSAICVDQ